MRRKAEPGPSLRISKAASFIERAASGDGHRLGTRVAVSFGMKVLLADWIPNLVEVVKDGAAFERGTIATWTTAPPWTSAEAQAPSLVAWLPAPATRGYEGSP